MLARGEGEGELFMNNTKSWIAAREYAMNKLETECLTVTEWKQHVIFCNVWLYTEFFSVQLQFKK